MAIKRVTPEALIDLALATLREKISPALPSELRYEAAMVVNALEISRREMTSEDDPAMWGLLDKIYTDGDGTPDRLATDIRAGTVDEARSPGLGQALLRSLEGELSRRNPRFLAQRKKAAVPSSS